jgi:hypothetical protein
MCANCSRRGPSLVGVARPKSRIRHYARRSLRWPGLIGADLGGSVYKKRVPLPGRGKRGGARILVATKQADRWFLLYGFGKNEQANIDDRELAALQKLANALLSMTSAQLEHAVVQRVLVEIADEEKSNPS